MLKITANPSGPAALNSYSLDSNIFETIVASGPRAPLALIVGRVPYTFATVYDAVFRLYKQGLVEIELEIRELTATPAPTRASAAPAPSPAEPYLVWTPPDPRRPGSDRSPRAKFTSEDAALKVAQDMQKRHGGNFFVMKAVACVRPVSQQEVVRYT